MGRIGKKQLFLVVLVVAAALLIAGDILLDHAPVNRIIGVGDQAPEFRLPDLNGRMTDLADFRGKFVMVHFWATWCPPCVEELPKLARLAEALKGTDFVLLAVSVNEDGAPAVQEFLDQRGLTLPVVLLDPDRAVASRYGTFKFPETYLLDRDGIVRDKTIGPANWDDPATIRLLRSIVSGPAGKGARS